MLFGGNTKLKRVCGYALAIMFAASHTYSDHFPIQTGNEWQFSYVSSSGGWGSNTTDSGTIVWQILRVDELESYPVQLRIHIEQSRSLERRTHKPGFIPGGDTLGYDSTFTPPRIDVDTIVLRGIKGVNGVWFEGDSCWSFVHDPGDSVPEDKLALTPVKVFFDGDSLDAVKVDPGLCRRTSSGFDCAAPRSFTTADGIGPVAYQTSSSPCLMDYYFSESWRLVATNVGTVKTARSPAIGEAVSERSFYGWYRNGELHVTLNVSAPGDLAVQLFSPNGALLGAMAYRVSDPGDRRLVFSVADMYACIPLAANVCIMRIRMPDRTVINMPITIIK